MKTLFQFILYLSLFISAFGFAFNVKPTASILLKTKLAQLTTPSTQFKTISSNSYPFQLNAAATAAATTDSNNSVEPEAKKSPLGNLWNEQTKLAFYLGVWYLGNVYCKKLFFKN